MSEFGTEPGWKLWFHTVRLPSSLLPLLFSPQRVFTDMFSGERLFALRPVARFSLAFIQKMVYNYRLSGIELM
jgi:hypothetical protein